MHSIYTPVRVAAAAARGQLLAAASSVVGALPSELSIAAGVIKAPSGRTVGFGSLAQRGAVSNTTRVKVRLKRRSQLRVVGSRHRRVDALDIVTGRKQFAMDLDVPGALPTMICRPPTINGTALAVRNLAEVRAMPGITDVVIIPHTALLPGGVAVRGRTFGQCIDAIRALDVRRCMSPRAAGRSVAICSVTPRSRRPPSPRGWASR